MPLSLLYWRTLIRIIAMIRTRISRLDVSWKFSPKVRVFWPIPMSQHQASFSLTWLQTLIKQHPTMTILLCFLLYWFLIISYPVVWVTFPPYWSWLLIKGSKGLQRFEIWQESEISQAMYFWMISLVSVCKTRIFQLVLSLARVDK